MTEQASELAMTEAAEKSNKARNTFLLGLLIVGIIMVSFISGALVTGLFAKPAITTEREQGNAVVAEEVIKSFKISTLTYRYTNIIYERDVARMGSIELPFTESYLGVCYDGVIEIGIDGTKIKVEQADDVITIRLPRAQILSHTQVDGSTEVLFDIGSLFNQNKVGDYIDLFESRMLAMEGRAQEMGLFEEAYDNAKDQLTSFLNSLPEIRDNYTTVFK